MANLFMGFDLSTQQLKITVINSCKEIVLEERVSFDDELPEFHTKNGVHAHADEIGRVTSPTRMWLKAIDVLFAKLQASNFHFERIAALGGCAQQHATVYWRRNAAEVLGNLDAKLSFFENLAGQFSVPDSPIWMDSSTTPICKQIEEQFGEQVHTVTGSRSYERFSGMQIAKLFRVARANYEETERIGLASSFFASLLIGAFAPIDASDGSGMNLLEIQPTLGDCSLEYRWNAALCSLVADGLEARLGNVVRSGAPIGRVSRYLVDRFGFSQTCVVTAFTGDNPASCVGIGMKPRDVCVSLGTSDTCFALAHYAAPKRVAHVFYSPLSTDEHAGYLILACFKNGSLLREQVRNQHAGANWNDFENALRRTPVGNGNHVGFYFPIAEILPAGVTGSYRFKKVEDEWKQVETPFADDVEVRAVCESQTLAKRLYCQRLGLQFGTDLNALEKDREQDCVHRVLVTGGASKSDELVRLIANVFGTNVYRLRNEIVNSASLGGALLAYRATLESSVQSTTSLHDYVCVAQPDAQAFETYSNLLADYEALESKVIQLHNSKHNS